MDVSKRITATVFAVALLALTGCGNGDENPAPSSASSATGSVTVAPSPNRPDNGETLAPNPQPVDRQLTLYFVALEDGGASGPQVGCGDSVVAVTTEPVPSVAPVRESLERLFAYDQQYYGQSGLYNALYGSDLTVAPYGLRINKDVVDVYLTGSLKIGGVCDVPRVHDQIAWTAATAAGVDQARVYINGIPYETATSGR